MIAAQGERCLIVLGNMRCMAIASVVRLPTPHLMSLDASEEFASNSLSQGEGK
jgi:hypothetical protein